MDDLPNETFDTARENSSAKANVVLTPRDELSKPAPFRADTLAEGNLMVKKKEIRARASQRRRKTATKKTPAIFLTHYTWSEDSSEKR